MDHRVPIKFRWERPYISTPNDAFNKELQIRALLVFDDLDDYDKPVVRCPNHIELDGKVNKSMYEKSMRIHDKI